MQDGDSGPGDRPVRGSGGSGGSEKGSFCDYGTGEFEYDVLCLGVYVRWEDEYPGTGTCERGVCGVSGRGAG